MEVLSDGQWPRWAKGKGGGSGEDLVGRGSRWQVVKRVEKGTEVTPQIFNDHRVPGTVPDAGDRGKSKRDTLCASTELIF